MQAIAIPPANHQPPGEFIYDNDFPILHHIVDIPPHGLMRPQRLINMVVQLLVFHIRKVFQFKILLGLGNPFLCQVDGFRLLIDDIILFLFQLAHKPICQSIELGPLLSCP